MLDPPLEKEPSRSRPDVHRSLGNEAQSCYPHRALDDELLRRATLDFTKA